ncbi:MAG: lipocalin family protein [Bacteroidia bacterium]
MQKLLFVLLASMALVSCSKDPNLVTNEALEGTWNITAYTVDNENVYGPDAFFDNGSFVFAMDEDFTGNVTTKLTAFPGTEFEDTQSDNGTYEISNEGATITITDSDGEKTVSSVVIDGTTLTMEYVESGATNIITAEKQ